MFVQCINAATHIVVGSIHAQAMALTPLLYIRRSDTRCGPGFATHQPVPTDSKKATQPTETEAVKHAASNPSNVFPMLYL